MSRNTGSCKNVMQDCRLTDYTPNCQLNEMYKYKYSPGSSSEYRLFLQRNACKMMDEERKRAGQNWENPTGCVCNYTHPPHDAPSTMKYHWRPSPGFLALKNKDFNKPIPSPGRGSWVNYC